MPMKLRLSILRGLRPAFGLRRFARDSRGISAVEFALLLPLMLTLYLGGTEISQAISIDRKVSLTTRAVADLVSQGTTISASDMQNILNASAAVMAPFSTAKLKVIVSSVAFDANKNATISWSVPLNTAARPTGQAVTVPAALATANSTIIWAEVQYAYTPAIGYVITGTLNLSDQLYMKPRNQDPICYQTCPS
jgi:Flp pilus assembly protein TadG